MRKETLTTKKFSLGMVVGMILICACYMLTAAYKARKAEQAALAARDSAAAQAPVH